MKFSVLGLLFGIAIFFIPFALNFMGAGDVKLMGAIGSLMGWKFTFNGVLYTAIVGGIIVIIMAIYEKRLMEMVKGVIGFIIKPISRIIYSKTSSERILKIYSYFNKTNDPQERKYIPYAIPITIGTLLLLFNVVPTVF